MNGFQLPSQGLWAGLPRETLKQYLATAQQAYHEVLTGSRPVSVSYSQETGSKSVTYTQANLPQLLGYIQSLQQALGLNRRRALRVRFR